jgi:hypothetical protein
LLLGVATFFILELLFEVPTFSYSEVGMWSHNFFLFLSWNLESQVFPTPKLLLRVATFSYSEVVTWSHQLFPILKLKPEVPTFSYSEVET